MDKIDQLEVMLAEARVEATSFYGKGNKAAGTRLRNKMQSIIVLSKEVRIDVQALKNEEK